MTTDRFLPSELTIYTLSELRPLWLAWLTDTPACDIFTVNAAAVAEVDAAGVQMLVSLQRSLTGREQALCLVDPSRTLVTACTALGLGGLLGAVEPRGVPA